MIIQQYIVLFGVGAWTVSREHFFNNQLNIAGSQLLVCPRCRTTWAMLQIEDTLDCWPVAQSCGGCGFTDEWMPVPGSILNEEGWGVIDDSLLAGLPEELVKREFNLHMRAYNVQAHT